MTMLDWLDSMEDIEATSRDSYHYTIDGTTYFTTIAATRSIMHLLKDYRDHPAVQAKIRICFEGKQR